MTVYLNISRIVIVLLCAAIASNSIGCKSILGRGQSPDNPELAAIDDGSQEYIRDITEIWGLSYSKVEGIALATQLNGTGSDPKPSQQKQYLLSEMRAHDIAKPNGVLASKDTSLVLVRGFMPPGIRKGEKYDVEVRTLPRSDTKSLRGGFLMETNLRQMEATGGRVLKGHVVGTVKGPIVVDSIFDRGDEKNEIRGRVLGRAVAKYDRPLGLTVNSENHSVRITSAIARAINNRFHVFENGGKVGAAKPKNDRHVELAVPAKYKHNLARYLEVVRSIKYRENSVELSKRIAKLRQQLLEPSSTKRAALHLEAIGDPAKPILEEGMDSSDHEVRFNSAMALAYLDAPEAARELGSAAKVEPAFRWHAMTALAAMDDVDAVMQLSELLNMRSVETRYGAFSALRARSPNQSVYESAVRPADFYFHLVPSESFPLIHFSKYKRPEITLFGHEQTVTDKFLYVKKGMTLRSIDGDKVKVSNFSRRDGDKTKICSNRVSDVIKAMVEFGMEYGEILEVFREAKSGGMLNSKLVIDATPKPKSYKRRPDEDVEESDEESSRFVAGPLPGLFRNREGKEQQWRPNDSPVYYEDDKPAKKSFFGRMTGWWSGK